jgi:hypothetical protein
MTTNEGARSDTQTLNAEQPQSKMTKREAVLLYGATGLAAVVAAGGMTWYIAAKNNQYAEQQQTQSEMSAAARADGFTEVQNFNQYDTHTLVGDLTVSSTCSLDSVRMNYVEEQGHITDITSYDLTLITNAVKGQRMSLPRGHQEQTIKGTPVEVTFTNLTSLTQEASTFGSCENISAILQNQEGATYIGQ